MYEIVNPKIPGLEPPNLGISGLRTMSGIRDPGIGIPMRENALKQIVTEPTRGKLTLDKIYTNISGLYQRPIIIPNVASSDHRGIALRAADQQTIVVDHVNVRNGKNLLAHAVLNVNWNALETTSTRRWPTSTTVSQCFSISTYLFKSFNVV
jgi:hypothetical protein